MFEASTSFINGLGAWKAFNYPLEVSNLLSKSRWMRRRQSGLKYRGRGSGFDIWGSWIRVLKLVGRGS